MACVILKPVRLLPTDELDEVMPKDDVVVTKQAKKKIKTLRLGTPIKSCSLTTENLRLASFFFVEAWVLSNDSNTGTSGLSPGLCLASAPKLENTADYTPSDVANGL